MCEKEPKKIPVGMWKFEWCSGKPVVDSYAYDEFDVGGSVGGCAIADDCVCNVEYGEYAVGEFVYPVHSAAPIKLFSKYIQMTQKQNVSLESL